MPIEPYAFLEALQRSVYESLGRAPVVASPDALRSIAEATTRSMNPQASAEEVAQAVERMVERARQDAARVPTPYEDPGWYGILSGFAESIERSVEQMGMSLPRRPAFGSLPTGQVNAMTIAVPGGSDHLIVFDHQMFLFALLLSKAVARAFPVDSGPGGIRISMSQDDIRARVDSEPSVLERFADVVHAYAVWGQPGQARQYHAEPLYVNIADSIRVSMEAFALGHEYGHVIAGHLRSAGRVARMLPNEQVQEVDYDWQQEYEADHLGVALSMTALHRDRRYDLTQSFWGADLFFSAMDIMDRAVSLLRYGDENAQTLGSHPPSTARRGVLRGVLRTLVDGPPAEQAISAAQTLEFVAELLWERTRPLLARAGSGGRTAATTWRG
ncbi:hypothetical protein [uncultured Cellulomonas sp.]|uniref:hypothetical protein n=1 Tax=uncultured Cellulomonas sp. TaxID=189682 RepID=UPI00260E1617|nr:hypothetical protein [uncultured Cellulomonas sp.]